MKREYAICQNPECEKEMVFVPIRKKKYCSTECYQRDPVVKKKKRTALKHFFVKGYQR